MGLACLLSLAPSACGGGGSAGSDGTGIGDADPADVAVADEEGNAQDGDGGDVAVADEEAAADLAPEPLDVGADPEPEVPEEPATDLAADPIPDPAPEEVVPVDLPPEAPPPPQGCILGTFQPFTGVIHAHTTVSDGAGEPSTAFAYARDTAKIDFLYITDHLEQLYVIPCLFPNDGWKACNDMADDAQVPGKFVAGCGFEYGTSIGGLTGHNNVFFSKDLFPCLQIYFEDFYESLADCADCIGQFNHPGDSGLQDWANFKYDAATDENMNLFEFNSDPAWDLFFQALDAGWHVSPVYNQDNHGPDWGTKNEGRAGFYMSALSRQALREAMKDRRSFATIDKDATIVLKSAEGCWMGSILQGVPSVTVSAEVADSDPTDAFTALEFWGPKATKLGGVDCAGQGTCTASLEVETAKPTYVFARALQADGHYLVSAPIWVAP
jgi:hypothetical protein